MITKYTFYDLIFVISDTTQGVKLAYNGEMFMLLVVPVCM